MQEVVEAHQSPRRVVGVGGHNQGVAVEVEVHHLEVAAVEAVVEVTRDQGEGVEEEEVGDSHLVGEEGVEEVVVLMYPLVEAAELQLQMGLLRSANTGQKHQSRDFDQVFLCFNSRPRLKLRSVFFKVQRDDF